MTWYVWCYLCLWYTDEHLFLWFGKFSSKILLKIFFYHFTIIFLYFPNLKVRSFLPYIRTQSWIWRILRITLYSQRPVGVFGYPQPLDSQCGLWCVGCDACEKCTTQKFTQVAWAGVVGHVVLFVLGACFCTVFIWLKLSDK